MARDNANQRGHALVFKNNGLVAHDTRELLLELGFAEVAVAARGGEALAEVLGARLDWALIDAGLPDRELSAVIEALDAAKVPFALVCSNPEGTDIAPQWQGRTYLARPYSKAELEALAPSPV
jgi:CheY-like chemotaxis protein